MTAEAALPVDVRADAITDYKAHPGDEHDGICPSCGSDDLYTFEQIVVERPVILTFVDRVTEPEVEYDIGSETDETQWTAIPPVILGLGCRTCRWSYKGPDPLNQAVPRHAG